MNYRKYFTEYKTKMMVDGVQWAFLSACEWKASQWTSVRIAACVTPVLLHPCREFIFAREFLFANE